MTKQEKIDMILPILKFENIPEDLLYHFAELTVRGIDEYLYSKRACRRIVESNIYSGIPLIIANDEDHSNMIFVKSISKGYVRLQLNNHSSKTVNKYSIKLKKNTVLDLNEKA